MRRNYSVIVTENKLVYTTNLLIQCLKKASEAGCNMSKQGFHFYQYFHQHHHTSTEKLLAQGHKYTCYSKNTVPIRGDPTVKVFTSEQKSHITTIIFFI